MIDPLELALDVAPHRQDDLGLALVWHRVPSLASLPAWGQREDTRIAQVATDGGPTPPACLEPNVRELGYALSDDDGASREWGQG
jgi:N-acetyl-anhydromuramyl-L-alanine amidase AmpD